MNKLFNGFISVFFTVMLIAAVPTDAEAKRSSYGGGYSKKSSSSSYGSKKSSSNSFFSNKKKTSSYGGSYSKKKTVARPKKTSSYGGSYGNKKAVASSKKTSSYGGSYGNKKIVANSKKSSSYGGNYSKSNTNKTVKKVPKKDSFQLAKDKADSKKKSKLALNNFRQKQNNVKKSEAAKKVPKIDVAKNTSTRYRDRSRNSGSTHTTYVTRRVTYYNNYNPPIYLNTMGGSWGGLSGLYLGRMFSTNNYDYMYYNRHNPGIIAYMAELRMQSLHNEMARTRLALYDQKMALMTNQNLAERPGYVPEGVSPDMMYSEDYVNNNQKDFYPERDTVTSAESRDAGGSGGVIFFIIVLLMGIGVWFFFFRRTQ